MLMKLNVRLETTMRIQSPYSKANLQRLLRSSFSRGAGSVMNLPGDYYRYGRLAQASDMEAIASDWSRVGAQIRTASKKIR